MCHAFILCDVCWCQRNSWALEDTIQLTCRVVCELQAEADGNINIMDYFMIGTCLISLLLVLIHCDTQVLVYIILDVHLYLVHVGYSIT